MKNLEDVERRIANSLVSNAEAWSLAKQRIAGLEQLLRMIGEASKEPDIRKLVALAFTVDGGAES